MDHLRWLDGAQGQLFAKGVMSQTWSALYWLERLFHEWPRGSIIELGAGNGALSVFFGLHCLGWTTVVDRPDHPYPPYPCLTEELHRRLRIRTERHDILCDVAAIRDLIMYTRPPVLVFCDNGDKPREFALYAPVLRSGDIIAVHDNGTEFFADAPAAQAVAAACALERWRREELDADNTLLAVWRKP